MLDENLPAFFLKPSGNGVKHQRDFFLSHHGSDPAPAYTLCGADPASPSPAHKNCYAAGLADAYNPEVLFGEVLARPGWTQPTLSAEELRRNGGVLPPPQPILPNEFTVQLYNPDQQIRVELKEGKWGASDHYEFSMPISTFRTPSASTLDRGQSDPASLAITPKVHFAWRKESKLSKDLTCFMTGSSTDVPTKKKSKRDPDIAIALWRSMRELTIYEPNLIRLDMEDPKGLEVVLLLSAVVMKDLYFGSKEHMREIFNISDVPSERKLSGGGRKLSNPQQTHSIIGAPNPLASHPVQQPQIQPQRTPNDMKRSSLPRLQTTPPGSSRPGPPPIADPRAQWELDAETARLKAQAEAEAREEKRRRREREKADEMEAKRLQRMVEEEDKQARRKRAEIDKETERLRKVYGVQPIPQRPGPPPQANSSSSRHHRPQQSGPYMQPIPQRTQLNLMPPQQASQPRMGSNGLYVNPAASSSAVMMSGANPNASTLNIPGSKPMKKKSFFGLRSVSDDAAGQRKLSKKSSAMW
ncbi:hypothetical protein LTR85_002542 [Meristemomyces frigidus]|nr:hypothetical protein LTR85_002542 [Meristemomyces frigidus]